MRLRPAHLLWLIPVLLVAVPVVRWLRTSGEVPPAPPGTPVLVATPTTGDLEVVLSYPGNLSPESTATIVPRLSGKIEQLLVSENQRVSQGDELVRLEADVVRIQSEQALAAWQAALAQMDKSVRGVRPEELDNSRATLSQAEKDVEIAMANLERTRRLFDAGTVPRVDFENAENQVQNAQTQLDNATRGLSLMEQGASDEDIAMARANASAAEKTYELALLQLDFATVRAPVSGTIATILVEEGNSVGAGTPLLAIINDDLIYANVAAPEEHYGEFIARWAEVAARVTPIAYADNPTLPGTVTSISPVMDPASRTFNVEIAVDNRSGLLRPGMFVNVDLVMSRVAGALLVPRSAVLTRNDQSVVFVIEGNSDPVARMIPVETGMSQNGAIQIIAGLSADDPIAVQGNAFLEDGQRVRPLDTQ